MSDDNEAQVWGDAVTTAQLEVLQRLEATAAAGDSDWGLAVYLYDFRGLAATTGFPFLVADGVTFPQGAYIRTVEHGQVHGFRVTGGDPQAYIDQVEQQYEAFMDGFYDYNDRCTRCGEHYADPHGLVDGHPCPNDTDPA